MLKSIARKEFLQKRAALSPDEMASANAGISQQFKQFNFQNIRTVHAFLPIVSRNEPDTFRLIDYLQTQHTHIQIVVSRSDFSNYQMSCHPYLGKADLAENQYHIPEPQTEQIFSGKIDLVLVPLLAFDLKGYRVGYGKGFYDRFLADKHCKKLGLSIFDPIEQIDDVHADDIRLDYCISPKQIYSFVN
jgi:5-formyltetrahydrofolate cyclo-ligase